MLFNLGRTIEYKFDKDTLDISVAEGHIKGQHKLVRPLVKSDGRAV